MEIQRRLPSRLNLKSAFLRPVFSVFRLLVCFVCLATATHANAAKLPVFLRTYDLQFRTCNQYWNSLVQWEVHRKLSSVPDESKTQHVLIDPWGGNDQSCSFVPSCDQLTRLNSPDREVLEPLPEFEVGKWIPPLFRLAELLGVGANQFHWDAQYIDPFLETRGHAPAEGYLAFARVRISLIGTFELHSAKTTPQIETFRRFVDARGFLSTGVIRTERLSDVLHYRMGDLSFKNEFRSGSPDWNPWGREKWYQRFSQHSRAISLSEFALEQHVHELPFVRQAVEIRLELLRRGIQEALSDDKESTNPFLQPFLLSMKGLQSCSVSIASAFREVGHQNDLCAQRDLHDLFTHKDWQTRVRQCVDLAPMPGLNEHESWLTGLVKHFEFHRDRHERDR